MSVDPQVELLLPAGALACKVEVVEESPEKLDMLRQVLINSGFAAVVFEGIIASRVSDEKLHEMSKQYMVLRFRVHGIGNSPSDPGGWLWVWPTATFLILLWLLFR